MTQKLLVCGFPHCGTSILKSIIGHIDDVEEICDETRKINKKTDKNFILCKFPFTYETFFSKEYEDYIKIFIIRNPLFVFSSLNKRTNKHIPNNHGINAYINTLKLFIKYRNTRKDVYTIRYEDLFDNNYQELRNILDKLGIKYTDDIFDNTKYTNTIVRGVKIESEQPKNTEHGKYRTWQINQPFVSNNDISKLDLTEAQKQQIVSNMDIIDLYPDIKSTF